MSVHDRVALSVQFALKATSLLDMFGTLYQGELFQAWPESWEMQRDATLMIREIGAPMYNLSRYHPSSQDHVINVCPNCCRSLPSPSVATALYSVLPKKPK